MKKFILVTAVLLIAAGAYAQDRGVNDVGTSPTPNPINWGQVGPEQTCEDCPPTDIVPGQFTGATQQIGRIFRDGVPSTCANKPYPGPFGAGPYNYETYTYFNFGPNPACITVNWDPDAGASPCGVNGHAAVYHDAYDPANQSVGFLGDVGSSVTQPFQVTVDAGRYFVMVASTNFDAELCTYAFQIDDVPCQDDPTLCEVPTLPAQGLPLLALMLLAAGTLVIFGLRRHA